MPRPAAEAAKVTPSDMTGAPAPEAGLVWNSKFLFLINLAAAQPETTLTPDT